MNAYNILSNCIGKHCRNDNFDENNINSYLCDATSPESRSLSLYAELLFCSSGVQQTDLLKYTSKELVHEVGMYDLHSIQSLHRVLHIQCTIIVTLIAIALARVVIGCGIDDGKSSKLKLLLRYLLEFTVISLSTILSVNVLNSYVEYLVLFASIMLSFTMLFTKCWQLAAKRSYEFGCRPIVFTLMRSSINILTAVCILAIDFKSFPKEFRKSRRFGVGLMDVGIGVFVFSMGLVASKPRKFSDLRKLVFSVSCLLALGLGRTLIITAIGYHQDKHEYGTHLNAFFTLGFTKLIATCFGYLTKSNNHLLTTGLVILLLHEVILQCGVWKYVMDPDIKRNNFISSNREGLCSLPGFVALYLLSQYLGKQLQAEEILSFKELKIKFKALCLISFILWLLVVLTIFVIGIARVTCNLGYVVWILAISVTLCTLYLLVFDIVLNTFVNNENSNFQKISENNSTKLLTFNSKIPLVVEAINFNGLTFFLLANILTGCTNMYFATDEKTNLESVFILFAYMFLTTSFIFILYRLKIRIA